MLSNEEQARYSKQIILPEIGMGGQQRLAEARVLVIGAGGLGCPVLQYLTAAGVGTIGIADGDNVSISNLQRQVLYTANDIGKRKVDIAVKKLTALNSLVTFQTYPVFIDSSNALAILKDYDVVVDGSDNFAARYLVNDACVLLDKPMVSGAIYKFEGQVSVFNYKGGPTYRCIFPEPPGVDESPNCADIGVIATLPGIIGTIQANEVIKIITGVGEVLSGKLLVIDTLTMHTQSFRFKLNEANHNIKQLSDLPQYCEPVIKDIDFKELQTMLNELKHVSLVDVREIEEHSIENIGGINIPLSAFDKDSIKLDRDSTIVLYCSSGVRSNRAGKILLQKGFTKVYNLGGGISQLIRH